MGIRRRKERGGAGRGGTGDEGEEEVNEDEREGNGDVGSAK